MIEIKEDVQIGDVILEAGDKIRVLDEAMSLLDRANEIGEENFSGSFDDAFDSLAEFLSKIRSKDFEKWIIEKEKEDEED